VTPVPEPAGDIRAQIAATLDPSHPKRACLIVPGNAERLDLKALPEGAYAVERAEGTLITTDRATAEAFEAAPSEPAAFDSLMAAILGLAEEKSVVVERCRGDPERYARAVQARDQRGNVVTETFTSPVGFLATCDAMQAHVPPGGQLVVSGAGLAISRRVAMRWVDE